MTRHQPIPLWMPLLALGLLLAVLVVLTRWLPAPFPSPVEPTATLRVIAFDPTPRAVESPRAPTKTPTAVPTERLPMATRTPVPTEAPSATPTPAPPTATPDISKRVERG